jgi:hypothetical protein
MRLENKAHQAGEQVATAYEPLNKLKVYEKHSQQNAMNLIDHLDERVSIITIACAERTMGGRYTSRRRRI